MHQNIYIHEHKVIGQRFIDIGQDLLNLQAYAGSDL